MRFLDVDILAGLTRLDGQRCMPVVVGCDDNRVDIFSFQNLAVVFLKARFLRLHRLNECPHLIHALIAQIRDCHAVGAGIFNHHAQDEATAAAATDNCDIDPFVRPGHTLRAQRLPRAEPRRRCGRALDKAAPRACRTLRQQF